MLIFPCYVEEKVYGREFRDKFDFICFSLRLPFEFNVISKYTHKYLNSVETYFSHLLFMKQPKLLKCKLAIRLLMVIVG